MDEESPKKKAAKKAVKKTARKKSAKKSTKKKGAKKKAACKFGFKNIKPPQLIEKWTGIQKHDPQYKNPHFWSLQMKVLKQLLDKYPPNFVEQLELPSPVESLIILKSDFHRKYIRRKYREFIYVPPKEEVVDVGDERVTKKLNYKKKKSIRSFLRKNNEKNNN